MGGDDVNRTLGWQAKAAEVIYSGAGASNAYGHLWSDGANWVGDMSPGTNDYARFCATGYPDVPILIDLDVDREVQGLYLASTTGNQDVVINSSCGMAFKPTYGVSGYIINRTTPSLTINVPIILNRNIGSTFNMRSIDGGKLYLNGNISEVNGGVVLQFSKAPGSGYGMVTVSGSNTHNSTIIGTGLMVVAASTNALGTGTVSIGSSSTLILATNLTVGGSFGRSDAGVAYIMCTNGPRVLTLATNTTTTSGGQLAILADPGVSTSSLQVIIRGSPAMPWIITNGSILEFDCPDGTIYVGGAVAGSGSVIYKKQGTIGLRLSAQHAYTGESIIRTGRIALYNASDRLPTNGNLVIESSGIFDLNGYTQTVAGLSGNGYITTLGAASTIIVNNALSPGTNCIGTLTCSNAVTFILGSAATSTFELKSTSEANDKVVLVAAGGNLTLAGKLQVENLGGLEHGDYKLFDLNGGTISGDFNSIVMPKGFQGEIDKSSGDVVLKVSEAPPPPSGTIIAVR